MPRIQTLSAPAFAGTYYCVDRLETGNPGGWGGTSLKTFDATYDTTGEITISPGETFTIDVWGNDCPESTMKGYGVKISFNPSLITCTSASAYASSGLTGPWDLGHPPTINNSAGIVIGAAGQFLSPPAAVDGDGDISWALKLKCN